MRGTGETKVGAPLSCTYLVDITSLYVLVQLMENRAQESR